MKPFILIILIIFTVLYLFFRSWDSYIKQKNRTAGKKYCEENDIKYVNSKSYELHTRLYFEKDGIKSWVNYKTDKNYNIKWITDTPEEKVKKISKSSD